MSGHNKWSKVKHIKGAEDAKRSKLFSKLSKEISVAAKEGGTDPEANPRLRSAIQNAKSASMPKDNIERAIHKSDKDSESIQEITYEGYAPHGIAIYLECMTDNQQRAVSNIKAIFNKHGGSLGKNGSLKFLFDTKGIFNIKKEKIEDIEAFELEIIDAGAEDVNVEDDIITITTPMEDYGPMQKKLEEMGIEPENSGLERVSKTTKKLDTKDALKVMKIIDLFEDDEDIQKVYHNLEIDDEMIKAYNQN
ncbi:MAG: YebC/PmpR family DNA-binding transcriptional regulator [Bacteroidales bacterium]|nr:YebC/PmpR family DNA-binding transcriptional regulator [Bacteroidales bacterium]MCF8337088.1 YebC/PmpR family DNA-binding transcriptional regulator [Bacteroidales bacterium]